MAVKYLTGETDWEDLRVFRALTDAGTLSAAARALGVTHATIARRVERLETRFGVVLFDKQPSGYALTAIGREVADRVAEMHRASLEVEVLQRQERVHLGIVRISAPRSISDAFLVPHLASVRERVEGIELLVLTDTRVVSIAKWETDIALRLGRPDDGDVVARKLGVIRYRFYRRAEAPDRYIGYPPDDQGSEAIWLEAFAAGRPFSFRSNSQIAQQGAAMAGLGIALLPSFLAADGLEAVEAAAFPPDREVFLMSRREALRQAHIRTTFDALVGLFATNWR